MKIYLIFLWILATQAVCAQQLDSAHYFLEKGNEARQQRKFKVAEQMYARSYSFDSKDQSLLMAWGNVWLEMRNYTLALEKFKLAEPLDPNNTELILSLANLSFNLHQYNTAIQYAQKIVDLHIGKGGHLMLARALYETAAYPKAIKACEAAFKEDTTLAEPSYIAARSFMAMEQYKNAALCYEQAMEKDTANVRWMYETALSWYAVPDDKKSLFWMERAREKGHPENIDFLQNLSTAYFNAGWPEKSLEVLLKLHSKKTDDTELIYLIADTYFKLKQYEKAIQYWEMNLQAHPKDAKALYMIGISYIRMGDPVKGQQWCDQAIAIDPRVRQ